MTGCKREYMTELPVRRVCIIGGSGKLGQYLIEHSLAKGWQVNTVCRERSTGKLRRFADRIRIFAGNTNDCGVVKQAVQGCDAVFCVLVPWGVEGYATGTAQALLDHAPDHARLIFSCGWHIRHSDKDYYSCWFKLQVSLFSVLARWLRFADISDQERACERIFASPRPWTVVRCSDLEEGASQGLPVWRPDVGDPALTANRTRRTDFALFMTEAVQERTLIHQAPAISRGVDAVSVLGSG